MDAGMCTFIYLRAVAFKQLNDEWNKKALFDLQKIPHTIIPTP